MNSAVTLRLGRLSSISYVELDKSSYLPITMSSDEKYRLILN